MPGNIWVKVSLKDFYPDTDDIQSKDDLFPFESAQPNWYSV